MARSFHGRGVSMPRGARASSRVTSMVHRRINQGSICSGVWSRVGDRTACGSKHLSGWRMSTQRSRLGGLPECYHTAVSVAPSTVRGALPYHGARVSVLHGVSASANMASRVGRRSPFSRGRPICPGSRAGGDPRGRHRDAAACSDGLGATRRPEGATRGRHTCGPPHRPGRVSAPSGPPRG